MRLLAIISCRRSLIIWQMKTLESLKDLHKSSNRRLNGVKSCSEMLSMKLWIAMVLVYTPLAMTKDSL